jgi:hypothetical protein
MPLARYRRNFLNSSSLATSYMLIVDDKVLTGHFLSGLIFGGWENFTGNVCSDRHRHDLPATSVNPHLPVPAHHRTITCFPPHADTAKEKLCQTAS